MFLGNFATPYGVDSVCHCVTNYVWTMGQNLNVTVSHYYNEQTSRNGEAALLMSTYSIDTSLYPEIFQVDGTVFIDAIEDVLQTLSPYDEMERV